MVKPSATREPWVPALLNVECVMVELFECSIIKFEEHRAFVTTFFVNVHSVHVFQNPTNPIAAFVAQRSLSDLLRSGLRLSKTMW